MSQERLTQLLEFLKEDSNDPFTIYAIATEYLKTEKEKAREYFEILLNEHPDYLATYYHAAHLFLDLGMDEQAEKVFQKGIEKAEQQQDQLSLRELRNAYNQYLFEAED